jgi:hypothetical protein
MNPNIANERKTGPVTLEGKLNSRMNALKTGQYSKILGEVRCNICKKKSECPYYQQDAKCSMPSELVDEMRINWIDTVSESIELYKLCIAKGLRSAYFDEKDSVKWFNLATKQLELIHKQMQE